LLTNSELFYKNIFINAKFSEKPVRLIGPGVKFSLFPALVPKTLSLVINIPFQSSLHGTIRTGEFQVIPSIQFIEFESESVHVTVKTSASRSIPHPCKAPAPDAWKYNGQYRLRQTHGMRIYSLATA